jgi:hypothetical protein
LLLLSLPSLLLLLLCLKADEYVATSSIACSLALFLTLVLCRVTTLQPRELL